MRDRQYVAVDVSFDYGGRMIPTTIHDTRGEIHWIERILTAHPILHTGTGRRRVERYTVVTEGQRCSLCFEQDMDPHRHSAGRWFLEGPEEFFQDANTVSVYKGGQMN